MKWILILIILSRGASPIQVEFETEELCERARSAIAADMPDPPEKLWNRAAYVRCVQVRL